MKLSAKVLFVTCLLVQIVHRSSEAVSSQDSHPLDPLSPDEISETITIIKNQQPKVLWLFIWITLKEPEKQILLPYFLSNNIHPPTNSIPRRTFSLLINPENEKAYEVILNLGEKAVESWVEVGKGLEPTFGFDETDAISSLLLEDKMVQDRLFKYECTNLSLVISDVWKYGFKEDKPEYQGKRIAQAYFYVRMSPFDNYYAHPLGFLAVIDTLKKKVVELIELPINSDFDSKNRTGDKMPVETGNSNFDPTVLANKVYRSDNHPIKISQEKGPSFSMWGNYVKWQHFGMRIGFNGREGLVLYHISYNDGVKVRPLIYRAALSEIFVPYGDPRPPYYRKMAFDAGEYGLGFSTTDIRSPEVCKGSVHFLNATVNTVSGDPEVIENAICVYEEDAGLMWRKTDPFTRRSVTSRSQRLVITFVTTLSNYDYQFKWCFHQDASIKVEVTLTGIVDPNLLAYGAKTGGHGNIIAPNINGQFHQHFFCVRIDTEIDGSNNTVSTIDVHPDNAPPGSYENPYGNGFGVTETTLKTTGSARTMVSSKTARTWKIIGSPENRNRISGTAKGWKLIPENTPPLMMPKGSLLHQKGAFVGYSVWVTPYKEDEFYAGGFYLNNSGLPEWVERDLEAGVENVDIVLWHVFGITHLPRVEDYPVMPAESVGFWLKPANFFEQNPSMDVQPNTD